MSVADDTAPTRVGSAHPLGTRRLFLLLGAVAAVLHVPGLVVRLFNSDEASIATMAMVLDHGGELYRQTADRKPPIVPYLYAAVFRLTGTYDIRPVRAVGVLVLAATALLLALEARRRYGSEVAAVTCGVVFLIAYTAMFPADSQAASFELFMLLPMTAAVVAAARGRAVAAGACAALAFLCKQTAAPIALPIAFLLLRNGGWRAMLRAAAAGAGIVLVVALAFGPSRFLLWTVTGNGGYLRLGGSVRWMLLRGLGMTAALAGVELGLVALCVSAARRRRVDADLWLWVAASTVGVVAGFRFFGHYFLELLPPLTLIAAGAVEGGRIVRRFSLGLLTTVAVVMIGIAFHLTGDAGTHQYPRIARAVDRVSDDDDTVLVWGQLPEVYWAARRLPASRFVHTGFLTGYSGGRTSEVAADGIPGAWTMLAHDVHTRLPDVVVDTTGGAIRGSQRFPLVGTSVWRAIGPEYRVVANVGGTRVYTRVRDGARQ